MKDMERLGRRLISKEEKRTRITAPICVSALLALTGCGSNLKMQWGERLEVDRGYAFDNTRFNQRGKEVDRSHVKAELQEYEESAPAMKRGKSFETGATIARGAGLLGLALGVTFLQTETDGAVPLMAVGGGFFGLSIGLSFAAEGNYVEAVERYNERVGGSEQQGALESR